MNNILTMRLLESEFGDKKLNCVHKRRKNKMRREAGLYNLQNTRSPMLIYRN